MEIAKLGAWEGAIATLKDGEKENNNRKAERRDDIYVFPIDIPAFYLLRNNMDPAFSWTYFSGGTADWILSTGQTVSRLDPGAEPMTTVGIDAQWINTQEVQKASIDAFEAEMNSPNAAHHASVNTNAGQADGNTNAVVVSGGTQAQSELTKDAIVSISILGLGEMEDDAQVTVIYQQNGQTIAANGTLQLIQGFLNEPSGQLWSVVLSDGRSIEMMGNDVEVLVNQAKQNNQIASNNTTSGVQPALLPFIPLAGSSVVSLAQSLFGPFASLWVNIPTLPAAITEIVQFMTAYRNAPIDGLRYIWDALIGLRSGQLGNSTQFVLRAGYTQIQGGNNGATYRGFLADGREVIVKQARTQEEAIKIRKEAEVVQKLSGIENVPQFVGENVAGLPKGAGYNFVMTIVPGVGMDSNENINSQGLAQQMRFRMSTKEKLDALRDLIIIIRSLQSRGIVHRDLILKNMTVYRSGGRVHLGVIDFGNAIAEQPLDEVAAFEDLRNVRSEIYTFIFTDARLLVDHFFAWVPDEYESSNEALNALEKIVNDISPQQIDDLEKLRLERYGKLPADIPEVNNSNQRDQTTVVSQETVISKETEQILKQGVQSLLTPDTLTRIRALQPNLTEAESLANYAALYITQSDAYKALMAGRSPAEQVAAPVILRQLLPAYIVNNISNPSGLLQAIQRSNQDLANRAPEPQTVESGQRKLLRDSAQYLLHQVIRDQLQLSTLSVLSILDRTPDVIEFLTRRLFEPLHTEPRVPLTRETFANIPEALVSDRLIARLNAIGSNVQLVWGSLAAPMFEALQYKVVARIDMRNLRGINGVLGDNAYTALGDYALREFADQVLNALGPGYELVRVNGDQYMVYARPGNRSEGVQELIVEALADTEMLYPSPEGPIVGPIEVSFSDEAFPIEAQLNSGGNWLTLMNSGNYDTTSVIRAAEATHPVLAFLNDAIDSVTDDQVLDPYTTNSHTINQRVNEFIKHLAAVLLFDDVLRTKAAELEAEFNPPQAQQTREATKPKVQVAVYEDAQDWTSSVQVRNPTGFRIIRFDLPGILKFVNSFGYEVGDRLISEQFEKFVRFAFTKLGITNIQIFRRANEMYLAIDPKINISTNVIAKALAGYFTVGTELFKEMAVVSETTVTLVPVGINNEGMVTNTKAINKAFERLARSTSIGTNQQIVSEYVPNRSIWVRIVQWITRSAPAQKTQAQVTADEKYIVDYENPYDKRGIDRLHNLGATEAEITELKQYYRETDPGYGEVTDAKKAYETLVKIITRVKNFPNGVRVFESSIPLLTLSPQGTQTQEPFAVTVTQGNRYFTADMVGNTIAALVDIITGRSVVAYPRNHPLYKMSRANARKLLQQLVYAHAHISKNGTTVGLRAEFTQVSDEFGIAVDTTGYDEVQNLLDLASVAQDDRRFMPGAENFGEFRGTKKQLEQARLALSQAASALATYDSEEPAGALLSGMVNGIPVFDDASVVETRIVNLNAYTDKYQALEKLANQSIIKGGERWRKMQDFVDRFVSDQDARTQKVTSNATWEAWRVMLRAGQAQTEENRDRIDNFVAQAAHSRNDIDILQYRYDEVTGMVLIDANIPLRNAPGYAPDGRARSVPVSRTTVTFYLPMDSAGWNNFLATTQTYAYASELPMKLAIFDQLSKKIGAAQQRYTVAHGYDGNRLAMHETMLETLRQHKVAPEAGEAIGVTMSVMGSEGTLDETKDNVYVFEDAAYQIKATWEALEVAINATGNRFDLKAAPMVFVGHSMGGRYMTEFIRIVRTNWSNTKFILLNPVISQKHLTLFEGFLGWILRSVNLLSPDYAITRFLRERLLAVDVVVNYIFNSIT
ncbi:hypothetical protein KBB12_03255, partial [Candidatus Woesebacteria bacterium]|nr:hypothetical protein [Candidatus Woesebacteria bacterium]